MFFVFAEVYIVLKNPSFKNLFVKVSSFMYIVSILFFDLL